MRSVSYTLSPSQLPILTGNHPRYELSGTPLPFSSDNVFNSLFPSPPAPTLPITKPAFTVVHTPTRTYAPSIAPCPSCQAKRVFECQLMPNLINVLRQTGGVETSKMTDEERRKTVENTLKGRETGGDGTRNMDWGTCMVFSCEKDCCPDPDGWREEAVLIQAAI
jgi:pre-rRNA-processing protein TSR4